LKAQSSKCTLLKTHNYYLINVIQNNVQNEFLNINNQNCTLYF